MCEPVTIGLALSAASAYVQYQGQMQQAKQTEQSAKESAINANNQLEARQNQENAAASEAMSQRAQESMRSLGRLSAMGADSGLRGGSFGRLAVENNIAANQDIATIGSNRDNAVAEAQAGKSNANLQARQRIASSGRPSLVGTGLQIAAGGLDSYTKYKTAVRS